jgi:hypothetical protein
MVFALMLLAWQLGPVAAPLFSPPTPAAEDQPLPQAARHYELSTPRKAAPDAADQADPLRITTASGAAANEPDAWSFNVTARNLTGNNVLVNIVVTFRDASNHSLAACIVPDITLAAGCEHTCTGIARLPAGLAPEVSSVSADFG